jgi:3-oxoacyl-[acyl-carrier-protein] synthase II
VTAGPGTRRSGAPVAVTGLGALTPLGPDVAALTEGLLSGRSGARLLDEPEFADLPRASPATVDLGGRSSASRPARSTACSRSRSSRP